MMLYQLTNKGSLRTLSLLIAVVLTACFFFNIGQFSTHLRTQPPGYILALLWATGIFWIHGIGFQIRRKIWQILFLPLFAYLISLITLFMFL